MVHRFERLLILLTLVVGLSLAIGGPAFAIANPANNGNGSSATGQDNAAANCKYSLGGVVFKQVTAGIQAGGGPKTDVGPANCDHFWQTSGAIGS